jgi:carboxyl-terminal processing protease
MNMFVIQAVVAAALAFSGLSQEKVPTRAQVQGAPAQLLESKAENGADVVKVKLTSREAGRIAHATGMLLSQGHYSQKDLDDHVSRTFFTNYLSSLDYSRLVFTQADVDEFGERYADRLDDMVRAGDASPAYVIFKRYLTRLEERNDLAQKILSQEVDFTTNDRFNPQRDKEPWPRDRAEADDLWRRRVKFDLLQGRLSEDKPEDVVNKLTKRYSRLYKTMSDYDDEEILSVYLTSLAHAYDPHSDYMSPSEARQFEISNVKLSLTGIGALLEWDDGYTRIKSLVPGGPAEKSKQLKPKDRIIAVAQGREEPVDVVEMRLNKVVELIRGRKDSEVRLTVVPADSEDGATRIVSLIRDDIPLREQFAKAQIVNTPTSDGRTMRLGIVILPQFYENCARDVETLIQRLKNENVEGLVLDLRRNGGGILEEAIELTGLFIREGPVVQVKNPIGGTRVMEDENAKVAWQGPLVVAVGHLSASASEIVAAALQDYGRAIVVGDSATHGKGTVQQLIALDRAFERAFNWRGGHGAGKLKYTISKFYRIAGGTTQKYGVTPDISLPSVLDHMELGESHLPNSLAADRTTPLSFAELNYVQSFVPTLRERSANRVAANREYGYILEDIEEIKKRKADPSVSLNEAQRIAEKAERKAREEARKKERAELSGPPLPIWELTLEAAQRNEEPTLITASKANAGDHSLPIEIADAAEEDADSESVEDEGRLEPQLRETLNILSDYLDQLAAKGQRLAVAVDRANQDEPGKPRGDVTSPSAEKSSAPTPAVRIRD